MFHTKNLLNVVTVEQPEHKVNKAAHNPEKLPSFLGVHAVDQLILEYLFDLNGGVKIDKELHKTSNYFKNQSFTLFDNQLPVMELAQAVIGRAQYNEVKVMLDKASLDPSILKRLLTTTITLVDPHHHKRKHVDRTVFQLAVGAEDYNVETDVNGRKIQVVDGIVELMIPYFEKLENGENIWKNQRDAQLPKDNEAKEQIKFTNDLEKINQMLNSIADAGDKVCQQMMALDSFHGIDLRNDPDDEKQILSSAIYLKEEKEGIHCSFRTLSGKVGEKLILQNDLKDIPKSVNEIIKTKETYLPTIINHIAAKGVFYSTEQIAQLQDLSESIVAAETEEAFDAAWNEFEECLKGNLTPVINIEDSEFLKALSLLKAIYKFRYEFEPKGIHTVGRHFNLNLLTEVDKLYDLNFKKFGDNWYSPKNVLSWQKVNGFIGRLPPGCVQQIIAQGSFSIMYSGERCKRSFDFRYGGGAILPLGSSAGFHLGYNCAGGCGAGGGAWWGAAGRVCLEKLCRAKTAVFKAYMAAQQTNEISLPNNVSRF